tara:strand:+ start:937 stop:1110 length:174 start_codon:yes stop_codon:yes gene_type:complete
MNATWHARETELATNHPDEQHCTRMSEQAFFFLLMFLFSKGYGTYAVVLIAVRTLTR